MSWRPSVRSIIGGFKVFEDLPSGKLEEIASETREVPLNSLLDLQDELNVIIITSKIELLKEEELLLVYSQLLKELELPKLGWVWWVDDYTRTKAEYKTQTDFKLKIRSLLPLLGQLIKKDTKDDKLLFALSPFTLMTPWTDEAIIKFATDTISSLDITDDQVDQLIQSIHQDFKTITRSEKVTKAGYSKAYKTVGFRTGLSIAEQNSRNDWKENHIKSISNLYTLLTLLDNKGIRNNWWLISPSILNIFDDHEGPIKLSGVRIVSKLLDVIEPEFLQKTGVTTIFQEAAFPLLSYLPNMTPTLQSKEILSETYPTLIKLLKIGKSTEEYEKGLLELLNNGIFFTLNTVRDNFELLQVLIDQIIIIIKELKIKTLKTLPRLIYHLGTILSDPFIDLHSDLFGKALDCLIELELNCWPALKNHTFDILGMVILSYKREKKTDEIGEKIKISLQLLERVIGRESLLSDYAKLVETHGELADLFDL